MDEEIIYKELKEKWQEVLNRAVERQWVKFGGTLVYLHSEELGDVAIEFEVSIPENYNKMKLIYCDAKIGITIPQISYFEDEEEDEVFKAIAHLLYKVSKYYGETAEWDWANVNKVKENK